MCGDVKTIILKNSRGGRVAPLRAGVFADEAGYLKNPFVRYCNPRDSYLELFSSWFTFLPICLIKMKRRYFIHCDALSGALMMSEKVGILSHNLQIFNSLKVWFSMTSIPDTTLKVVTLEPIHEYFN